MTEYEIPTQYGWICPRCGQVNAPWMCVCTCQNHLVETVTYSDRTDYKEEREEDAIPIEWIENILADMGHDSPYRPAIKWLLITYKMEKED